MGFIKDAKASQLGTEAQKAHEDGDYFFTPLLNSPSTHHGMSGNIRDWAVMVQAVEAAGWVLDQWTVAADNKGRPQAYPLFRRR